MSGQEMQWIERIPEHQPAWIFLSFTLLLGFLAWIRLYYRNSLVQTVQASSNFQVAARMFKDNSLLQKQLDNILYVFYFLSTAFFLYMVEIKFHWLPYGLYGFLLYGFNVLLLAGVFSVRIIAGNLGGFLFNRLEIFKEYAYNTFIFNKIIGISVLPFLLFAFYTTGLLQEIFQWMAIGDVIVLITMRIVRGIIFSYRKDISIIYMFLYLCALEITPLLLLYRWLEGTL
jgi:hypothetical protein